MRSNVGTAMDSGPGDGRRPERSGISPQPPPWPKSALRWSRVRLQRKRASLAVPRVVLSGAVPSFWSMTAWKFSYVATTLT
jgi:hypothetical protein